MERTLNTPPAVAGVEDGTVRRLVERLKPMWRYAVFTVCLFAVSAFAVAVRLDTQGMRKDLDRNTRLQREAQVLNDRLTLEMDARRRAVAVEAVAGQLGLGVGAEMVRVPETSP